MGDTSRSASDHPAPTESGPRGGASRRPERTMWRAAPSPAARRSSESAWSCVSPVKWRAASVARSSSSLPPQRGPSTVERVARGEELVREDVSWVRCATVFDDDDARFEHSITTPQSAHGAGSGPLRTVIITGPPAQVDHPSGGHEGEDEEEHGGLLGLAQAEDRGAQQDEQHGAHDRHHSRAITLRRNTADGAARSDGTARPVYE